MRVVVQTRMEVGVGVRLAGGHMPVAMGVDQVAGQQERLVRQDLLRRTLPHQAVVLGQDDDPIGDIVDDRKVMCRRDDRLARVALIQDEIQQP